MSLATLNRGINRFRVYIDGECIRARVVGQPSETAYMLRERIAAGGGLDVSRVRVVVCKEAA